LTLCYVYLMVDRKAAAGLSRLKQVLTAQQSLAAVTKWPLMNEMRCPMPARMILALMLGMLVLPACQQDEPPLTTEGAISLREKAEQGQVSAQLQLGRMYDMGQGVPQDYKEAFRWYQAAANQGDADSQSRLGLMYATGKGIPQDYKEAFRWYQAAAEQGQVSAQSSLGRMYDMGQGVPQDYKEAFRWYQAAAEQGTADAQRYLGFMYVEGRGVPQDFKEAVRWWRAASEQGHADAQSNLGVMYTNGQGVPQDYIQAHMWYNLAASGRRDDDDRKMAAKNRDSIAEKMTPEQIAEAQRLAREWRPKTGSQ